MFSGAELLIWQTAAKDQKLSRENKSYSDFDADMKNGQVWWVNLFAANSTS